MNASKMQSSLVWLSLSMLLATTGCSSSSPADSELGSQPEMLNPEQVQETGNTSVEVTEPVSAANPSTAVDPAVVPDPSIDPDPSVAPVATNKQFCEGFDSSTDSFVVPALAKPDFMATYNDPTFGGQVTRITNSVFGEVNKPAYSTMQAWNADETYLMLYRTGVSNGGHKLLNGHTYAFIRDLDIYPADLEQVWWSRTDPDAFFYISRRTSDYGKFNRFSIRDNRATALTDFSAYCGSGLPNAGNDVQMHAVDDEVFGFRCQQDDGHYIMLSYNLTTDEVITAPIGTGSNWSAWTAPVPSASGSGFLLQGSVLEPDLQTVRHKLDLNSSSEHSSLGSTHDGKDAYYHISFGSSPDGCDGDLYQGVGHLLEHSLETGDCRNIISQEQGYTYPTSSTHMSALAYLNPGRVALSSIGNSSQVGLFTSGVEAPPLFSEIYVAQTDPADTVVCRYAHHRSYGKSAQNGGYAAYFGEPHATISPSGTRVIFGSDWYDSGSVDSYVLEMPDYVRP